MTECDQTYASGCRCAKCRRKHAAKIARQRRERSYKQPPEHGTVSTYTNWKCRCTECTEAARVAVAENRATRRTSGA